MKLKMPVLRDLHIRNTKITKDCVKVLAKRIKNNMKGWGIDGQQHFDVSILYKTLRHFTNFKECAEFYFYSG